MSCKGRKNICFSSANPTSQLLQNLQITDVFKSVYSLIVHNFHVNPMITNSVFSTFWRHNEIVKIREKKRNGDPLGLVQFFTSLRKIASALLNLLTVC